MIETLICSKCKIEKPISEFNKRKDTKLGYRKDCKKCKHETDKKGRDREKQKAYDVYYYQRNKLKRLEQVKKWVSSNRDTWNAFVAKREADKLRAVPEWLNEDDFKLMKSIYQAAKEKSEDSAVKFEVDHVVPLRGKNVCGLHCPENLQVITATENRLKSNKF